MKQIFFFCILTYQAIGQVIIESSQKCLCVDIQEQVQCESINCYWDEKCLENKCENKKQAKCFGECQWSNGQCINYNFNCNDYSTQKSCDQQSTCGWSTQEKCLKFEKCSEYLVTDPNLCYSKGTEQCEASTTIINGKYQCRDKVNVDCGIITSQNICNNSKQSSNIKCRWKQSTDQCLAINDINSCENVKDWQEMCDTNACVWLNNTCKTRECSSFTIQKTCKYIPNYAQTQISICVWTEDKCQTLLNSNELSQDQCFQNTKGGYMWINDGCVSCHAYFLNIITMLIIFIFLG